MVAPTTKQSFQPVMTTFDNDVVLSQPHHHLKTSVPPLAAIEEDLSLHMSRLAIDTMNREEGGLQLLTGSVILSVSLDFLPSSTTTTTTHDQSSADDEVGRSCLRKSSSPTTTTKPQRQVHFGSVSVRRYDVMVGDNPSCRKGIPLTMDWTYRQQPTVDLDDYQEMTAPLHQKQTSKRPNLFYLNSYRRKYLLIQAGFDEQLLQEAKKMVKKDRLHRKMSNVLVPAEKVVQSLFMLASLARTHNKQSFLH